MSFVDLENYPRCKKLVLQQDAHNMIFVGILQSIFSALMEAENLSQNNDYTHFCNSVRNTSIKTHRLQKRVARHMRNFLHRLNMHIFMPFLGLTNNNGNGKSIISLFHLTNQIGRCFNCFFVLLICLYSQISSDLYISHIILCILMSILCPRLWV